MSEWLSIDLWPECRRLERPGIVFEVANEQGQQLLTPCSLALSIPPDWTSPPTRFRAIPAPKPRHSAPIPLPTSRSRQTE